MVLEEPLIRVQLSVKLWAETSETGPSLLTCLVPRLRYIPCLQKLCKCERRVLGADHRADWVNHHNASFPGQGSGVTDLSFLLDLAFLAT